VDDLSKGGVHCKIGDFGLSKGLDTQTGKVGAGKTFGTLIYAAPEVLERQVTSPPAPRHSPFFMIRTEDATNRNVGESQPMLRFLS
jgi:serine/threonine protein kinase